MKKYTKELCLAEAKKYSSRSSFRKGARWAHEFCWRNNFLDEACSHMKPLWGKWNVSTCQTEALKYKTRKEFQIKSKGAYLSALRKGFLYSVCKHMEQVLTFWDKEKCIEEAKKYNSRAEYSKKNGASYQYALKNNIIEEVCVHMEIYGNLYKRLIYVYEFSDNHAYVGLTYNENKRKYEHVYEKKGPVAAHVAKTGLIAIYKKLEDYVDVKIAKELENKYIGEYRNQGWIMLNKSKAGALGGNDTEWTFEKCRQAALNFNRKHDLRYAKGLGGCYNAIQKHGWMEEICSHMTGGNIRWTKEKCKIEALKYTTRAQFQKSCTGYHPARKQGWLEEICSHMKPLYAKIKAE
jgi:hypothetical protein